MPGQERPALAVRGRTVMNAAEYLISTFEHPKYGTVPKWVWNVSLTEITRA